MSRSTERNFYIGSRFSLPQVFLAAHPGLEGRARQEGEGNMTTIKNHDFIEMSYTGKVRETGEVFDTTDETVAKAAGLFEEGASYRPIVICVGKGHLIRGIDEQLIGKEAGGSYRLSIDPEKGFGKKNPKLLKLMSSATFKKQEIAPQPGLQVSVDGAVGTVRSATGGRVVVDFNHPLAGRQLDYEVTVVRILTAKDEQGRALARLLLGYEPKSVAIGDGRITFTVPMVVPEQITPLLTKEFKELIGLEPVFTVEEKAEAAGAEAQPVETHSPSEHEHAHGAEGHSHEKES